MNRPTLNLLVDLLAFIAFALLTATGILTRYVLPPGSGRFTTIWGLDRHGWGHIHFWIAVALLAVLALHLVLHWRWIQCMIRGQHSDASGARLGLGLVGLISLLGLAAAPFFAQIERTAEPPQRARLWQPPVLHTPQPGQSTPTSKVPQPPSVEQGTGAPRPPQEQPPAPPRAPGAPENAGVENIRGSMTLREVTELTGVPVDYLIKALGLPGNIDPDERIGRLRKQYGTGPDDVRRVVKEYGATH